MSELKKVWSYGNNKYRLNYPVIEIDMLENAVYNVGVDDYGYFLYKVTDSFEFGYKIYGLESKLINRVLKTYTSTPNGNLGVLLNGVKGTGKTVSGKLIANALEQPIIMVGANLNNIHMFLNSIPQNITIFIDEYEKVFEESTVMLTIMDGMMNSDFRRVFLLTTNNLYIDKNLIERPGRIRYLKTFDGLEPKVIEEIVDDILEYPNFKQDVITFISNLSTITVDIVKSVINEVNIHNEAPSEFESVFNVSKLTGKYDVSYRDNEGNFNTLAESVVVNPKPLYNDNRIGYHFSFDGKNLGEITKVINFNTIEVTLYNEKGNVGREVIQLNIEHANSVNYAYAYDGYGSSTVNVPKRKLSDVGERLIKAMQSNDDDGEDLPFDEAPKKQISFKNIVSGAIGNSTGNFLSK